MPPSAATYRGLQACEGEISGSTFTDNPQLIVHNFRIVVNNIYRTITYSDGIWTFESDRRARPISRWLSRIIILRGFVDSACPIGS